jgi:hypothetical protein
MRKVALVSVITRLYFIAALVLSFTHLVHAGHKGGLTWESWTIPFMVDGIACIGLIMRSTDFASRTRSIGFRVQVVAGLLSLAGNVYAAHNAGTAVFGIATVALFVFSEWLSDQIKSAAAEAAELAITEAAAKKAEAIRKGQATRARKAASAPAKKAAATRRRKAEVANLEAAIAI